MNEKLIAIVQEYVEKLFRENAPPENIYHNLEHTKDVVAAASEIALAEEIAGEDIEIILIAAWFHDSGCIIVCKGHEDISSKYARSFLESINYPEDKIKKVLSVITATKVPQNPKNKLEEVLCDADLHHLGTKDFDEKGYLLRQEIEKRGDGVFNDEKWLHHSFEFLKGHHFFTSYAKEKYGIQKNINLTKIAKQLESIKEKKEKVLAERNRANRNNKEN